VELYALQEIVTPLRALGASLVAVSPQLPEHSLSIIQKTQLSFDILRDAGNAYTAELGLRFALPAQLQPIYRSFGIDLPACNGDPAWTLPMPARLVIDREGIVRAVDADPDYTVRPEPEKTLADVKKLSG
jgi:peroxiredoxin